MKAVRNIEIENKGDTYLVKFFLTFDKMPRVMMIVKDMSVRDVIAELLRFATYLFQEMP